jgi:hypothetical protein
MRLSKKGNLVHGMWVERFETKDIRKANLPEFGMPYPLVKAAFVVGCWERPPLHGQLTDQGWGRFTINIANGLCYQRWKRISATNAGNESRPSTRVRHEIC